METKKVFKTENKIMYVIGVIFIVLCFFNVKMVTNKDNSTKLSLSVITTDAKALGEGGSDYWTYICYGCVTEYCQPGVIYDCVPDPCINDCFRIPCGYGQCG
jgi:hypothetical protein